MFSARIFMSVLKNGLQGLTEIGFGGVAVEADGSIHMNFMNFGLRN